MENKDARALADRPIAKLLTIIRRACSNRRTRMLSSAGKPLAIAIPTGVRFARPFLPLIRALKLTGVSGAPTFSKAALGLKRHGC